MFGLDFAIALCGYELRENAYFSKITWIVLTPTLNQVQYFRFPCDTFGIAERLEIWAF